MNKIIGGPFGTVPMGEKVNNLLKPFDNLKWFISGRAAFFEILKDIIIKTRNRNIWIPSFYCPVISDIARKIGFAVHYYDVNISEQNELRINVIEKIEGTIVLMKYYGFENNSINNLAGQLKRKKIIIIEDITQSILSENRLKNADYYFASLRKWIGIETGGFATGIDCKINYKNYESYGSYWEEFIERYNEYLMTGQGIRKEFGISFYNHDKELNKYIGPYPIKKNDCHKAMYWDLEYSKNRRRKNAKDIIDSLGDKDVLIFKEIDVNDTPYFVPIKLKNRIEKEKLRNYLDANNVFCSDPWDKMGDFNYESDDFEKVLELVCDERYDQRDIFRMLDLIKKYFDESV